LKDASLLLCVVVLVIALGGAPARAQSDSDLPSSPGVKEKQDDTPQAPKEVDVQPVARDAEIRDRLLNILRATTWFENPRVEVREGVVFLDGRTGSKEHKAWAKDLARHTQDVVAVVNRIALIERSPWDLSGLPSWC
jgi:osmotically-inducible protein OsmY